MIFRHGPLQLHPGVTKIRVRAGNREFKHSGSARTYHSLRLPGGGGKLIFFIN